MALVKMKRNVPEMPGHPTELMCHEEDIPKMKLRGWLPDETKDEKPKPVEKSVETKKEEVVKDEPSEQKPVETDATEKKENKSRSKRIDL